MSNEFTPIPGYETYYMINETGIVISLHPVHFEKEIVPKKDRNGYVAVRLYKNGKACNYYLHRLLATVFIPNPLNKPMINHINGKKKDNRIDNLEWVTNSENMKHAVAIFLVCPFCKKRVIDKCTGNEYSSIKEAALNMNINYEVLKAILRKNDDADFCLELAA
jgi:hypothetical protein